MKESAIQSVSFSPMKVTAALSIAALVVVSAWQLVGLWTKNTAEVAARNGAREITIAKTSSSGSRFDWQRSLDGIAAEDPDGLSNIGENVLGTLVGSYVALKDAGTYTPAQGAEIAQSIAEDLRATISFRKYIESDITTDDKTSLTRTLAYRSDMRVALEPLLKNTVYELEVFGGYLETKDPKYLTEFEDVIQNYQAATENVARVVVPKDALDYHLGVLNALSEFGTTLEKMAKNVDDPFASAALLRTFNDAETNVFSSFDALAGFFRKSS